MPEPQIPTYNGKDRNGARQPRLIAQSPSGLPSPDESAPVIGASSAAISDDAAGLWSYIRSRVGFRLPPTEPAGLALVLRQPKLRDLDLADFTPRKALNAKQQAALVIQIVGEDNPKPCSECRRHPSPLDSCVSLSLDAAKDAYRLLTTSARACANCLLRKRDSQCSLRRYASFNVPGAGYVPRDTVEEPGEDLFGRRRSTRISIAHDDDDTDAGDEGMADPAPRLRSRRSALRKRPAAARRIDPPTEADLHMESWEMTDRRLNAADERMFSPSPLAFHP
jgi:hypothetical protein